MDAQFIQGNKMKTIGIILSGGVGNRFNAKIPKQYMSLNGPLVIQYVINAFQESKLFDKIIIVINKQYIKLLKNTEKIIFVPDGKTRNNSIKNAIDVCPKDTKYVLFHDAARPFIKPEDLIQYLEVLKNYDAAITSVKITDAMYPRTEKREEHALIQTPEAFHFEILKQNFNIYQTERIAIYQHLPDRYIIKKIELVHTNLKITYPQDIFMAEQLMKYQEVVKRESNVGGKNVLILGGTGGIGSAITKQLKKQGACVYSMGSEIDLSKETIQLSQYIPDIKWDCIIHAAGAYEKDENLTPHICNRIMNVNFKSIVYFLDKAPYLIKKGGSFIAIGSTAAAKGRTGIALYSASKAALNAYVEGMAEPLSKLGIRVNVICPAKVATPLQTKINPNADPKDMIQPNDLAKIIIGYITYPSTGNIIYIRCGQE